MEKKALTIIDIARLAGVSKSTVSRVLTNDPNVKPETSEKVQRVMAKYDYYPNQLARSLVTNRSSTVGLVTPFRNKSFSRNKFFREVFRGLSNTMRQRGYDILVSSGTGVELDTIKKFVNTDKVAGITLLYSIPDDPSLHYLVKNEVPFSLIGYCDDFDAINLVTTDYEKMVEDVVLDLVGKGCERVAFLMGDSGLSTTLAQLRGFENARRKSDMPPDDDLYAYKIFSEKDAFHVLDAWRAKHKMPRAILAHDELIGCAVIQYCKQYGLHIPDDIAMVCLEDGMLTNLMDVSAVNLDYNKMGELSGDLLIDTIESKKMPQCLPIDYTYIQRASTSIPLR